MHRQPINRFHRPVSGEGETLRRSPNTTIAMMASTKSESANRVALSEGSAARAKRRFSGRNPEEKGRTQAVDRGNHRRAGGQFQRRAEISAITSAAGRSKGIDRPR